ncbi:Hypothetical predicted protein [Pelobates cultripes]|uniref:Uncharacterized protein n=1 Tax=Pelobates cultripes TaxID=61616 RepID=A0AAD1TFM4_PELCU|nr:Hypothetical predicted protein [Pelobates cultripes]
MTPSTPSYGPLNAAQHPLQQMKKTLSSCGTLRLTPQNPASRDRTSRTLKTLGLTGGGRRTTTASDWEKKCATKATHNAAYTDGPARGDGHSGT